MHIIDLEYAKKQLEFHKRVTDKGCWEWPFACGDKGHGVIVIDYKKYYVHRLSAAIYLNFDLGSELQIRHKCHNPSCYNFEHLTPGTHVDNMNDTYEKNRTEKSFCINGHEYTEENTLRNGSNPRHRRCRTCVNSRNVLKSKVG